MRILILHSVKNLGSLRRTTLNQSFCLLKYAPLHEYTLHCYGQPIPPAVREGGFDAVIIDTTFLWYRWSRPRSFLVNILDDYGFIAGWDTAKIALPQDDYDHCDVLDEWLADWGVCAVFTPLAKHSELLYPRCSRQARILQCLTGHVDVADAALAECWSRPFAERRIDVGYRAAELPAQFGRLGRLKSEIGARFVRAIGPDSGLVVDASTDPKDMLAGDTWLRFLGDSRFTLGAPSGSSLLDRRGLIQDAIREYLQRCPNATFEQIEAACFPGEDGRVECVGLGPRNIEAGLAQSCQILVAHSGLAPFEPDVHYIPLDPDCANIDDVRAQMRDDALVAKRVAACRELLKETPELRYPDLAERIFREIMATRCAAAPSDDKTIPVPQLDPILSLIEEQRILVRLATSELAAAVTTPAPTPNGPDPRQAELAAALKLRVGRMGAIREFMGINDDIDGSGNIVRPEPWPKTLQLYRRCRQVRSIFVLRATARQLPLLRPVRWVQHLQALRQMSGLFGAWQNAQSAVGGLVRMGRSGLQLQLSLRETISSGCRSRLRTWRDWMIKESPYWKRELRRWRTVGPAGMARLACGRAAGGRRTATMLVADNAIDRRVLLSARSLHNDGWKVTVIALPYPYWPDSIDEDQLMFPEFRIERLNPYWPVRVPVGLQGLIDRIDLWQQVFPYYLHFLDLALFAPAEVYIAHDLPALPAAATAAEALNALLIYDAHELYPEQRVFDADHVALLGRAERELIRRARLVTTVNASIAAEISQRYSITLPEVLLNAPAAPSGGLPVAKTELIRERLGCAPSIRILLFQGRLAAHRNLETLVAAMDRVETKDVILVLMGPDGGIFDELCQMAGDLHLLDRRVYFLDPVRQDVLLSWTASADIGIIPYPPVDLNSRLCTPNKLFEFIVAELPILANDLLELRRFVTGNGFGQNHPMQDPAALAAAIDQMCATDLSPYRSALRRRAAEFVWDIQGSKLIDLYDALPPASVRNRLNLSPLSSRREPSIYK